MAQKELDLERGKRITELISARGYDLFGGMTKLAKEVGVERAAIYRWKAGEAMSLGNLERLAVVLGTTITWIMSGTGPKYPPTELLPDPGQARD